MQRARIAVVLGMHRSGTSAVTEYVASLGFNVPGSHLEFLQEVNERGFWESLQVVNFNESLLQKLGLNWYSLKEFSDWDDLDESIWQEMIGWLNDQLLLSPNLVVKDPRINILLPVWQKILSRVDADIFYINVNRHPDYVVQSIKKRDGFDYAVGYSLWLKYVLKPFEYTVCNSCFFINYEDLINGNYGILGDLSKYLTVAVEGDFSVVEPRLARNNHEANYSAEIARTSRSVYKALSGFSGRTSLSREYAENFIAKLASYYRFDTESLDALDEAVSSLVSARKSMIENGTSYTKALGVIEQKESYLNHNLSLLSELQEKIKDYEQEITRIRNIFHFAGAAGALVDLDVERSGLPASLDVRGLEIGGLGVSGLYECVCRIVDALNRNTSILAECNVEISRLENLLKANERDREHNEHYIASCNDRIFFLESVIQEKNRGEDENAAYIDACHKELSRILEVIKIKEQGELENTRYIAGCHEEISRLLGVVKVKEQGELENIKYIANCHEQISTLDKVLQDKELGEMNNYNYIEKCHVRIAELEKALSLSEAVKKSIEVMLRDKEFEFLKLYDSNSLLNCKFISLVDEFNTISAVNDVYKKHMELLLSDISLDAHFGGAVFLDSANIERIFCDYRSVLLSILSDRLLLIGQLNAVLTELSVCGLRVERMEGVVAKIKNKPFLSIFNNNILNGL